MTTKGFIELNAQEDYCQRLVSTKKVSINEVKIHPNPVRDFVEISWEDVGNIDISIVDILEKERLNIKANNGYKRLRACWDFYNLLKNGRFPPAFR